VSCEPNSAAEGSEDIDAGQEVVVIDDIARKEIPERHLHEYDRISSSSLNRTVSRSVPVAALLLALVAFLVFKPSSQKQTADVISSDDELQDVFTVASRIDPAGLKPVQSLFEVQNENPDVRSTAHLFPCVAVQPAMSNS
jgi:hypothetical protein